MRRASSFPRSSPPRLRSSDAGRGCPAFDWPKRRGARCSRCWRDALAEMDGQLLLPLEGPDLDADGAFALAEEAEQDGDLGSAARRWYELAARLDRDRSGDPVQPRQRPRRARPRARGGNRLPAGDRAQPGYGGRMVQPGRPAGKDRPGGGGALDLRARLAIDPAYADALHNAALLHMRSGRFAEAALLLVRIRATSPANAAEIRRLAHLCRLEARRAETRE